MARFIDPTGNSTYGIALCARCSKKFPLHELAPDPNYPGLMVCDADRDEYDPYRLAPRSADKINLPFVRPDVSIATNPSGIIGNDGDIFITTDNGEEYLKP